MNDANNVEPQEAAASALVKLYKETQTLPDLVDGWIVHQQSGSTPVYRTLWRQCDPAVTESWLYFYKDFTADGVALPAVPTTKPGLVSYYRPREIQTKLGQYLHLYNSEDGNKFYADLMGEYGLVRRFDLSGADKHGNVYTNSEFGAVSFSPDGGKVVYVAERKKPITVSYFKENVKGGEVKGGVFDHHESWGEQLEKCCHSVICILDISSGGVTTLHIPDNIFPSKPAWSGNTTIFFTGLDLTCSKHGAIYCWNRPSRLYSHDLSREAALQCHTPAGSTVQQPSPGPGGIVAFLMCPSGGPHRKYMEMWMFSPSKSLVPGLVPSVEVEGGLIWKVAYPPFFGHFSSNPWSDDKHILLTITVEAYNCIVKINIHDHGKSADDMIICSSVQGILDQCGDTVLYSTSGANPFHNYKQSVKALVSSNECSNICLNINSLDNSDAYVESKIISFERDSHKYNGILVTPANAEHTTNSTLIIYPHGGPHSVSTDIFRTDTYVLARLGYSILMVNYTGSLGLGEECVEALLGHVGDMDVKDVQHAAECVKQECGYARVVVMGGSHGGFLAAHLIGQYPDFYKAAVIRNPVIDMSSMAGSTDIPDWCYCETGLGYDFYRPSIPDSKSITAMLEKSPVNYVDKVRCPVMLNLGGMDLRVPPSQGLRYARLLKSRGVNCEVKWYPEDCHPLSKVATAGDVLVQTHLWFNQHAKPL